MFKDEVKIFNPDVIGFTAVSSQFSFVADLCDLAKNIKPQVMTVCGGIHPTLYPECLQEAPNLDVIFRGDSEVPFLNFLQSLEKKESWKENESIAFLREDGTVKKNK